MGSNNLKLKPSIDNREDQMANGIERPFAFVTFTNIPFCAREQVCVRNVHNVCIQSAEGASGRSFVWITQRTKVSSMR